MNELDREAVLGTRLEEIQKLRDRQQVKQLVREKDAGVSSREARKKTTTGTSNEKTAGLAALAKKRQTKARKAAQLRMSLSPNALLPTERTGRQRRRRRRWTEASTIGIRVRWLQ